MAARMKLKIDWSRVGTEWLPFADAATPELPLKRLLRLSLFQISVAMSLVLLTGTLNRVMIVELHMPAWIVSALVAVPLIMAPIRALVGHKSDSHRSVLGWRRVPYIWFGTMMQFGGFAIMPFAILILSGDHTGSLLVGEIGAALAFLLVGVGMHTAQTAGLALATDLAPDHARPRVVALLYVMLLVGTFLTALIIGRVLVHFSALHLIQVIQGVAALTMVFNLIALWKQEARNPARTQGGPRPSFLATWRDFRRGDQARRRLVALGIGTVAFSMQDILLEPYGGHVLGLPVAATTAMTALLAVGGLVGFGIGARLLGRGADPYRLAGTGALAGLAAFSALIFAAPLAAPFLFALGVAGIGLGAGLFAHCTLTAAISTARPGQVGLVLGVWGAVQASAAGCAVALGGLIRDGVAALAADGRLGPTLATPATGYVAVYTIELVLLFATLAAVGPLVRVARPDLAYAPLSRS